MAKKSISSLELAALLEELQFLKKSKLTQIYHQEEQELLFQFHVPNKGKQLLKIVPGKFLCHIPLKEETPLKPSSFCMQLRKYLSNAFVKDVWQKDAERIVVFNLEKEEKFTLIIELFSKGNIILVDDKGEIITALERQIWKDRVVKPGEKYLFPATGVNWKTITEKELGVMLGKSEKRNLATALATEVGLGGSYAEETCTRAGVDKDSKPNTLSRDEVRKIAEAIHSFIKLIEQPKGFFYGEEITPFPLEGRTELKVVDSYNEAIATLNPYQKKSPYEQKIKTLLRMVEAQDEAIKKHEENIILNTRKGEVVYENYAPLQKLLTIVREMRKTKDWKDIAIELKKEKKIKSVDLKNKRIVVEL